MTKAQGHKEKYDFLIIGSGPAGIHAAVQVEKLGRSVAIIEKHPEKLGGAWLQTGTIPSKTMRETLAAISSLKFHVGQEWLGRLQQHLSAAQLFGRAFHVAGEEEAVVRKYLGRNGVEIITGYGVLESATSVRVLSPDSSQVISAEKILIATGSAPRRPDDIPFDGWRVVDSDELLLLDSMPKQMIIYGAGVIGCEYASIFNAFGVEVTIYDAREQVMQQLDREMTQELRKIMEDSGVKFEMGKSLTKVHVEGPKAVLTFGDEQVITDLLFFAAGRVSVTSKLGLEKIGVKMANRGAIAVNENFQTSVPTIYAAGDAIGMPALAATSAEQGRHAACHAFGQTHKVFPKVYPVGIYTIPEMSSVGRSEEELVEDGVEYVVGRAYFTEVARGYIRGDNHGLLKYWYARRPRHCYSLV